jgi:DNA invertase Pin-like site-specific DNA recombinase
VSTGGQRLESQLDALKAAGCRKILEEKLSGKDAERPELAACLAFMTPGDTLVVPAEFIRELIVAGTHEGLAATPYLA